MVKNNQPLITVVSPSIREGGLDIVAKCLQRQTFKNWEWVVSTPYAPPAPAIQAGVTPKGDYHYSLNRDWNRCFRLAKGELMVSIVDLVYFPPDTLEKLWDHYVENPLACIGGIGHQYDQMENGKPEHRVWSDPRVKPVTFYPISPLDLELCIASIPLQGIKDVGGMRERWDFFAALSEKELCYRIQTLGYTFLLDQSIEYRALQHPRLTTDWDDRYQKGIEYFNECIQDIKEGKNIQGDLWQEPILEQKNTEKKLEK